MNEQKSFAQFELDQITEVPKSWNYFSTYSEPPLIDGDAVCRYINVVLPSDVELVARTTDAFGTELSLHSFNELDLDAWDNTSDALLRLFAQVIPQEILRAKCPDLWKYLEID